MRQLFEKLEPLPSLEWQLKKSARFASTSEKECLAVVWAIRKFRPYLEGYTFKVLTDHVALKWLHNLKNPTGQLAKWALQLLEYDYEIVYRKGSLNYAPDALLRTSEKLNSRASTLALIKETKQAKLRMYGIITN